MPNESSVLQRAPIAVAPMMAYTDRHFRYLLRLLSPGALLYTEMVTAQALKHGDPGRWLTFSAQEHPLALQLGGSDPDDLAQAARLGETFGYDEINLNCGCPSDRVQSGRFGACLMAEPQRVADCVQAMREAVKIPVTVKCRIGIEPRSSAAGDPEFLLTFIHAVVAAGCRVFIVHARKAVLGGLSPKENREVPPLRYELVRELIGAFPDCHFVLNGGIRTVTEVQQHLETFAGVMLGRAVCDNPYLLAELHRAVCDPAWTPPARESVIEAYVRYAKERVAEGEPLSAIIRHALGLFAGLPRARSWRRYLSEQGVHPSARPELLLQALRIMRPAA